MFKLRLFSVVLILSLLVPINFPAKADDQTRNSKAGVVTLIKSDADGVIIDYSIPEYELTPVEAGGKSYWEIKITDGTQHDLPGEPNLPMMTSLIGVPPNAKLELSILNDDRSTLEGNYSIVPGGAPAPLEEDLQPGKYIYIPNESIYTSNQPYPRQPATIGEDAWMRDQRLVRLEISPFQYIPAKGELTWHKNLRVELKFIMDKDIRDSQVVKLAERSQKEVNNPFDKILSGQLINYDNAKQWKGIPSQIFTNASRVASSPQTSDPMYKITIDANGIYKVTYADLLNAGMDDINKIDPTTFGMTNQGRPVAIYVDNSDGDEHKFSSDEYILFFGEKFDGTYLASLYPDEDDQWRSFQTQLTNGNYSTWTPQFNKVMVEKYTDKNVYWLTVGGTPGLRMNTIDGTPGEAETPASYRTTVRAEQSHKWKTFTFTGEDTWFWEEATIGFPATVISRIYSTLLTSVYPSSAISATVRGEIVATSNNDNKDPSIYPDHDTEIFLNKNSHPASILDQTWDGKSRYHFEVNVSPTILQDGENILELDILRTQYMTIDSMLFDWFEIDYDRLFQADSDQIEFTSNHAGPFKYVIDNFSSNDLAVFDITDPLSPTIVLNFTYSTGTLSFGATHESGERYFAGKTMSVDSSNLAKYTFPDYGTTPMDYVYITNKDLITGTNALANYRASQGLSTMVVDIDDLYNIYNFGIYNPIAVKNFLKDLLIRWEELPTYVVLIGDGHWNFKGYIGYDAPPIYIPPNLAWVDPWQGEVDSSNLLAAVVGNDPIPDVLIARMPVTSNSQLDTILSKTILHEGTTGQEWQKRFIFVADDTPDDAGDFVAYSEKIINDYHLTPKYIPDRQYLDTYKDSNTCGNPSGKHSCPAASAALTNTLNINGALILNYVGHASLNIWAGEGILINEDIPQLNNGNHLPILLSLTCLDGYWIYPNLAIGTKTGPGLVEELLRMDNKGIVAAFSPDGLGVATGHDYLQRGFYDEIFKGTDWVLGEAALAGKLNLYTSHPVFVDLVQTYTVFGDPALRSPKLERNLIFIPIVLK